MSRHIVLLRGINVGSQRRIAMADLRAVLAAAGFRDVRTFLQSGNVLLESDLAPGQVAHHVERQISCDLQMNVAVVVRSRDELADVVARNPLAAVADDPKRHQVSFLSQALDQATVARLQAVDVAPERFVISGREIFAWYPLGIQRSPLERLLSARTLPVTATARNWNTVTKLLDLARG
jgi:uncharacterized protein (DUF1697 family)